MYSIKVNISKQLLTLHDDKNAIVAEYPVSTSKYGIGSEDGSYKTPLGHHQICEKIGEGKDLDEVFIGREPKGRLADLKSQEIDLPEDIITARILRLQGMEAGLNQGGGIDSFERYIYIHGTSDESNISKPVSHGCIRMRNIDVISLYDKVDLDTDVLIEE